MYYILLNSLEQRSRVIQKLREAGINAVFHYVPLHSAPAGIQHGRVSGTLVHTDDVADRLLRMPLWIGAEVEIPMIVDRLGALLRQSGN